VTVTSNSGPAAEALDLLEKTASFGPITHLPIWEAFRPELIEPAVQALLDQTEAAFEDLEKNLAPSWDALMAPLERLELRELVLAKIHELPEAHRNVLLLRDIEELDTEEAARVLEISTGAVKTRLHRARLALRGLLEPHLSEGAG